MQKKINLYLLLLLSFFLLGVLLRSAAYFQIPSLWLDEATTANKIISIPIKFLVQIKDSNYDTMQAYPIGFLLITKLITILLGISELSLRLFPFICGIFSVFLFKLLSEKIFDPPWPLLSTAIFSLCYPLIYHSVELKPYSSDVLITIAIILVALHAIKKDADDLSVRHYGAISFYVIIFSFPATLIIFSYLGIWLFSEIISKNFKKAKHVLLILIFSGTVQIAYYMLSLRYFFGDKNLIQYWNNNYLPCCQGFRPAFSMLWVNFCQIFNEWGVSPLVGITLLIIGIIALARREKHLFLLFCLPIAAALFASAIHIYPFVSRTVLFLTPCFIVIICYALIWIAGNTRNPARIVIAGLLSGYLIASLAVKTIPRVKSFSFGENSRPLIFYLANHRMRGEDLFINTFANESFIFYQQLYDNISGNYNGFINDMVKNIYGKNCIVLSFESMKDNILYLVSEKGECKKVYKGRTYFFRPGRNWFLFVHSRDDAKKIFLNFLDSIGERRLMKAGDSGAILYLYDIKKEPQIINFPKASK